jgi:hypothetical protein
VTSSGRSAPIASSEASADKRRRGGVIGTLVGVAAAGVAAGVAAERLVLRSRRRSSERDPYRDEPLGLQHADEYRTITTD